MRIERHALLNGFLSQNPPQMRTSAVPTYYPVLGRRPGRLFLHQLNHPSDRYDVTQHQPWL